MLQSLRQSLLLNDFYLEIDLVPSLCRTGDTYGLLLRAFSTLDDYRLLVNCDGQLRLERLKNGKVVLIRDWTASGQIPPGGMLRFRLGVWALKDDIQVFVNDVFQFSVRDPVWDSGQIGVYARATQGYSIDGQFFQASDLSPCFWTHPTANCDRPSGNADAIRGAQLNAYQVAVMRGPGCFLNQS